jgi:antitoxin MazE
MIIDWTANRTIVRVARWGNTLAIRIPRTIAKVAGLAEGDQLELKFNEQGQIVLRRARPRYKPSEFLAGVTPENVHGETELGVRRLARNIGEGICPLNVGTSFSAASIPRFDG